MPDIQKTASNLVADNGYVEVTQDFYTVDGKPRNYLILGLKGGGKSVLMIARRRDNGAVAFVRNLRANKDLQPALVLPGGLRNHTEGETIEEAARRELFEEIGLVADRVEELGVVDVHPLVKDDVHVFLMDGCRPPSDEERELLSDLDPETLDVEWLDNCAIDAYLLDGWLQDGQTIAALRLLEAWQNRQQEQWMRNREMSG